MSQKNVKLAHSPKQRKCKDCIKEGMVVVTRAAPYPGPRCTTHHRAETKRRDLASHGRKTVANYGITSEEYWAIYEAQGRCCGICRRSKGYARRLAVDHDHNCDRGHPRNVGCRYCVRALLCKRCNMLIGWWGVEALLRAIHVITKRPAQLILNPPNTPPDAGLQG